MKALLPLLLLLLAPAAEAQIFFWWSPCKKSCWHDEIRCRKEKDEIYDGDIQAAIGDRKLILQENKAAALRVCRKRRNDCFDDCREEALEERRQRKAEKAEREAQSRTGNP